MEVILAFGLLIGLILGGMWVQFAVAGAGLFYLWMLKGFAGWKALGLVSWGAANSFTLAAIPLFVLMAEILLSSGLAGRLYNGVAPFMRRLPGGLLHTNIVGSGIFAAISGGSAPTAAAMSTVSLPELGRRGYDRRLVAGSLAAGGTLGILIPPSIMLVIMSDQLAISLGDLFMGALFPGLILGALYILFIVIYGFISPDAMPAPERTARIGWSEVKEVLVAVVPPMFLILLVLGSIFVGLATPTEASGLGAFGATLLALFARKLNWKVFREVARSTLNTSGYIVGIFLAANFFAYVLRRYGGDEIVQELVLSAFDSPYWTVAFILFIVFCLGFLLDWIEITIIIMPLMLPIIQGLELAVPGYDQVRDPQVVWFAILVAVTLQTSFLTPPVGFALFYLKGVCPPGVSLSHIYRGIIPFVVLQLIGLFIVFEFPQLTTWLPSVAYGN